jgi:ADP-heptose:LPS heptosyltransferase
VGDIEQTIESRLPNRPWLTAACDRVLRRIAAKKMLARPALSSTPPTRLLVVKVHGMGDSVLVRSILEQLKSRHPEMDIGVLAGSGTAEILTQDSSFRVHMYRQKDLDLGSALSTLFDIRRCHYQAILNFEQGSLAGTAFLAATGIPIQIGFVACGQEIKARFLTHTLQFDENRLMWQSFVRLARLLDPGLGETITGWPIRCSEATERWLQEWWAERNGSHKKAIAFHLGCARGMDFRRWPLERFVELAQKLRSTLGTVSFVLTGTEAEKELIRRFMCEYSGHCIDASDLGAIERTIAVLGRCGLLISNDTGIMHLGAAMGVPTVGLFGPNTPRHWAPVGPRATYVYDTVVSCSPCINNYINRTPVACTNPIKSHCMYDISVASVLAAAKRVVVSGWMN